MIANMATELEFFLFSDSYEEAHAKGYRNLQTVSQYNEDYHNLSDNQGRRGDAAIRNGLHHGGVPVENSKGEACARPGRN